MWQPATGLLRGGHWLRSPGWLWQAGWLHTALQGSSSGPAAQTKHTKHNHGFESHAEGSPHPMILKFCLSR